MSRTFGLLDGVALLEAIAREPPPSSQVTPETPYRVRCCFRDAIRRTDEENAMSAEGSTSAEQVRVFKRTKRDIADVLPRRDVADMRDVLDVMTEEEKDEWRKIHSRMFHRFSRT